MNFEFSEEQLSIQEQARTFLREECPLSRVRAVMEDDSVVMDVALWKQIAELGWMGATIPEAYGGLELGPLALCVLAQELGRSLAPVPFSSTVYLFAEAVMAAGSEEQKQALLPKVAEGSLIGCLATVENYGDGSTRQSVVSSNGLSGSKMAVADAQSADYAVVQAADDQGNQNLYLVSLHQAGVVATSVTGMDLSRSVSNIAFENAECELLGGSGQANTILNKVNDAAAVYFAFEQLAGSEACMAMGMEYTKERYAFGRQIASFQAIKHIFADMFVAIELARANSYYAAWALSVNDDELPLAAATARVSATDAYYYCSSENIEAHGGMGFTWEFDCHLF